MNDYKYYCVINAVGYYKTLVLVITEPDAEGVIRENIQGYKLQEGESLVPRTDECRQPTLRPHASAVGFIRPRWDGSAWVEGATAEEITAWENEHPAPEPPMPTPVDVLGAQVAQLTLAGMQKDQVVDALGTQLVQTKLDVITLKSMVEGGTQA